MEYVPCLESKHLDFCAVAGAVSDRVTVSVRVQTMRDKGNPMRAIEVDTPWSTMDSGLIIDESDLPEGLLEGEEDVRLGEDFDDFLPCPDALLERYSASGREVELGGEFNPTRVTLEDLGLAHQFIRKAIECSGIDSAKVPSQKQIQKLGMHTTKQQRAREVLRSAGAIVVNFRTELTPRFQTLGDVHGYLEDALRREM